MFNGVCLGLGTARVSSVGQSPLAGWGKPLLGGETLLGPLPAPGLPECLTWHPFMFWSLCSACTTRHSALSRHCDRIAAW